MKNKAQWEWKVRALHDRPRADAETVTMSEAGSNCDGEALLVLEGSDGGPPSMTAAEWKTLALVLVSRLKEEPVELHCLHGDGVHILGLLQALGVEGRLR